MVETLHSEHVIVHDNDHDRDDDDITLDDRLGCRRTKAMALFVLGALPTTVVSVYLWHVRHVPSMAVTTFIGISAMALCLFCSIVSLYRSMIEFLQIWFMAFGGIWTIGSTNGIMSPMFVHKAPMRWGLTIGSLAYFTGGIAVLTTFVTADLAWWAILNTCILAPLCTLGLATKSSYLLQLTASGILMNAFHLCQVWTHHIHDSEIVVALIYFVIVGGTGLGTAFLGWLLSRRQDEVAAHVGAYLDPYVWPALPPRCGCGQNGETTGQNDDDEDMPSGSDLQSLIGYDDT